jgi:hypothetical protein
MNGKWHRADGYLKGGIREPNKCNTQAQNSPGNTGESHEIQQAVSDYDLAKSHPSHPQMQPKSPFRQMLKLYVVTSAEHLA